MDINFQQEEVKSASSQDLSEMLPDVDQQQEIVSSRKRKKKRKLVIMIVIASVLSIGLLVAGFFWYRNRGFSISPNVVEMESDGGSVRVKVEGPSNWKILNTPKPWVYIVQDDEYLVCTVNENLGFKRGDTISIGNNYKSCSFVIKQESGAFVASPSNVEARATSGEYTFYISGRTDWIVEVGPEGWGSVTKSGDKLLWHVSENYGDKRSDIVTLRSGDKLLNIGLEQCGALTASHYSLDEGPSAHTKYVTIDGPDEWDVRTYSYWMDVSRDGNRVKVEFEKNDDDCVRDGYIEVYGGGQEIQISVTQKKQTTSSSSGWSPYWYGW